jgi:hypothetical protein
VGECSAELRAEVEQRVATEAALRAEVEQRSAAEAAPRVEVEQRATNKMALQTKEAELLSEIDHRAATRAALRKAADQAECDAADRAAITQALEADIARMRRDLATPIATERAHGYDGGVAGRADCGAAGTRRRPRYRNGRPHNAEERGCDRKLPVNLEQNWLD